MSESDGFEIGQILLELGRVSKNQLDRCLELQRDLQVQGKDVKLGEILVREGVVSAGYIDLGLDEQNRMRTVLDLGGYRLLAKIGHGGMGAVFEAEDAVTRQMVALKIRPPQVAGDELESDCFVNEIAVLLELNHPNIVPAIRGGVDKGYQFLAMEYIEGENIEARLERDGPMDIGEAAGVAVEVARALDYLHEQKLIHRDVKPKNIMIRPDGRVILTDFGLVLDASRPASSGAFVGTPAYMSPEQAGDLPEIDIRSDIYSLGATLYHMLCGRPPFEGERSIDVITQVLSRGPDDPREVNPDVPEAAAEVILKMLARQPRDRYGSPAELIPVLERLRP